MDYELNNEINRYYLTARMPIGRPERFDILIGFGSFNKHSKSSKLRSFKVSKFSYLCSYFKRTKQQIKRNKDSNSKMQPILIRFGAISMFLTRANIISYVRKFLSFRKLIKLGYILICHPLKGYDNPWFY